MPEQDQRNGHADVRTLRRFRPSRPARRHSFRQRPPHAPAGRRHRPTRRVAGSASDQGHPAHPTRARRLKRHLRTQHVTYPEAVGASFRTRVGHGPTTSDREHPRRDRAAQRARCAPADARARPAHWPGRPGTCRPSASNAAANIRRAPSATISAKRRRRRSAPHRPTTLNIGVIFLTGAPTPVLARLLSEEGTVRPRPAGRSTGSGHNLRAADSMVIGGARHLSERFQSATSACAGNLRPSR
jgi:hypothetical protein